MSDDSRARPSATPTNAKPTAALPRRGPELAHELLDVLVYALSKGRTVPEETASEAASAALVAVLEKFGGKRVWIPRLRRDADGLSWFRLSGRDREIARVAGADGVAAAAELFGYSESSVTAIASKVRLEARAVAASASEVHPAPAEE